MTDVTIDESNPIDCHRLAAQMRPADVAEMAALGFDPLTAITSCYRDGILRTTYFVDGEVAAMSGMGGALLGDVGRPYLLTAAPVERARVSFLKCAKKAVHEMLLFRPVLEGEVMASYTGAVRLLQAIGFTIGPEAFRGVNGEIFLKYQMRKT